MSVLRVLHNCSRKLGHTPRGQAWRQGHQGNREGQDIKTKEESQTRALVPSPSSLEFVNVDSNVILTRPAIKKCWLTPFPIFDVSDGTSFVLFAAALNFLKPAILYR